MKNDLETKVRIVKKIITIMKRENDEHMRADLYRLTNRTLEKINMALLGEYKGQSKINEAKK